MNKLSSELRSRIVHLLCEGMSIRAITRTAGVSKLLFDTGLICAEYHDKHVRNVAAKRVQVDEIWSFTYAKQKNVAAAKAAPDGAGDTWTWTAIDADSKLVLSWFVGGRDAYCAKMFINDLASRLSNRVQLTSDGLRAYLEAVPTWTMPSSRRSTGPRLRARRAATAPLSALARSRRRLKASLTRSTSARATSSVRTSLCGCICAASRA